MQCKRCNEEIPPTRRSNAVFCSDRCRNSFNVAATRRNNKRRLVELFGGECVRCGYDKCLAALQFHHLGDKSFGLAAEGQTRSFERLVEEAEKCILICANCHAEEHA